VRHVDEYRDPAAVGAVARELREATKGSWSLMEVCGGQTHSILKFGVDALLPPGVRLIHGPGCPVCVTPLAMIDRAVAIAARPDVIFCSFGDMLRVPGSREDLLRVKARGGDVRVVYSPLDALKLARQHPERRVVFFAVGFETTAPANAMAVHRAAMLRLTNFSVLVAHVLVPPALHALLSCPDAVLQGLLAPGHVCTVTGFEDYEAIAEKHRIPIVVTGFEPLDLLRGVLACVRQLEAGRAFVENRYPRAVRRQGNPVARARIDEVFVVSDRSWRGLGEIPRSGYTLAPRYAAFDAEKVFDVSGVSAAEPEECRAGLVLQGRLRPTECPEFSRRCTPEHPLGATMVSSEGACAAYFHYRRPGALPVPAAGR
jgi:hydrogenase expression/formation protein HypD